MAYVACLVAVQFNWSAALRPLLSPTTVSGVIVGAGSPPSVQALKDALLQVNGMALPEDWDVGVAANSLGWQATVRMRGAANSTAERLNALPKELLTMCRPLPMQWGFWFSFGLTATIAK